MTGVPWTPSDDSDPYTCFESFGTQSGSQQEAPGRKIVRFRAVESKSEMARHKSIASIGSAVQSQGPTREWSARGRSRMLDGGSSSLPFAARFRVLWGTSAAVSARFLLALFDSVYVVALSAWVGSILFFSFGVAPIIFGVLGAEAGGKFVRALFPRYYTWGAVSGAIALPAYLGVPLSFPELRGPIVAVQALVIVAGTLIMLYAGNALTPAINAARDAGPAAQARFDRLHRRSVRLNVVALLLGLALLVAFANRPPPMTSGIVEPAPLERARAAYERARALEGTRKKLQGAPGRSAPAAGEQGAPERR